MTHGFGSGLGFFFRNVDPLLQSGKIGRLILVDWIGMGGSHRLPCRDSPIRWTKGSFCNSMFTPSEAVDFFVDPLETFLKEKGIGGGSDDSNGEDPPFWLVGHSLGGYLAARYVLRHPHRSPSKLILASPVGFPPPPDDIISPSELPTTFRLLDTLWSANVTPQQLVRLMGANRGRNAVSRALRGRIPHLDSHDADLLADYLFHITVAPPSGEFAMNSLLEPIISKGKSGNGGGGVFAREPLEDMGIVNELSTSVKQVKILFGDHDWMRFNEPSARSVVQGLRRRGIRADVSVLSNAGHHLYLDNSDEFVSEILT